MQHETEERNQRGWKHWFWMAVCCIPMIAIIILIVLGYWSSR